MKKMLKMALAVILALSVSSAAFAETRIHYTFTDEKTGTVYQYGSFENGDADAGVIVNSKRYSLKNGIYTGDYANAFVHAQANGNKFMLGLKPSASSTASTYNVTPYSVDSEENLKTGQAVTVNTNAYKTAVTDKTVSGIVTDDIRDGGNNYNVNVSANYTTTLTTKADYNTPNNSSEAYTIFLKLNLSDIKDEAAPNSNYVLNVTGKYAGSWSRYPDGSSGAAPTVSSFKVAAAGVPNVSWTTENFLEKPANTSHYKAYVAGNPVLDSVTVPLTATDFQTWSFNITGFVQQELAKENYTPTIALFGEYNDLAQIAAEGGVKHRLIFTIKTVEAGADNYSLTYQVKDPVLSQAELKTLTVGGEPVDLRYINPANKTYTKYLPYGTTEAPEVEATANKYANVSIISGAGVEDDTLVEIISGDKTKVEQYYVKYVVAEKESAASFKALGWEQGVITNGNDNVVAVDEQTSGNKLYSYSLGTAPDTLLKAGYIMVYNSPIKKAGYEPNVTLMQLDLNRLVNVEKADLSKPVVLSMDGRVATYNASNPSTSAKISIFDASDNADWSYINGQMSILRAYDANDEDNMAAANAAAANMRAYLRNTGAFALEDKTIVTRELAYGNYGLTLTDGEVNNKYNISKTNEANGFAEFDISEFVRYCYSTGNLTPTIAFYLHPSDLTVIDRQIANFYFTKAGNMSYIDFYK